MGRGREGSLEYIRGLARHHKTIPATDKHPILSINSLPARESHLYIKMKFGLATSLLLAAAAVGKAFTYERLNKDDAVRHLE